MRARDCTICVFAKPPRPGEAKTRLATAIGPAAAAELARAMLEDTWRLLSTLTWADLVLATTEIDRSWIDELPFPISSSNSDHAAPVWQQGSGDLGERLERMLRTALMRTSMAIAIGTDSPGLP